MAWRFAALSGALVAGLFFVALPRPPSPAPAIPSMLPPEKVPSRIIVYVVDALRPDHLEAYGYERETAPAITRLAREGALFTRGFSNTTWTLESVRGLFIGMEGAMYSRARQSEKVPEHLETLAERFKEAGWTTGLVTENVHVTEPFGLAQGFDFVGNSSSVLGSTDRAEDGVVRAREATRAYLERFLAKHSDKHFFLYVHTMETHEPLVFPDAVTPLFAPGARPQDNLAGWYDTAIRVADRNFASFLDLLKERGLDEDTLLVLTADHGESLVPGRAAGTHRGPPLLERVRVPLIVRWPGMVPPGCVIDRNVQLLDIGPTVLDAAGLSRPAQFQGKSLVRLLTTGTDDSLADRPIFTVGQAMNGWGLVQGDRYLLSVRGSTRFIALTPSAAGTVRSDEAIPRLSRLAKAHFAAERQRYEEFEASQQQTVLGSLRNVVGPDVRRNEVETPQLSEEEVKALEALGYVE